MVLVLVVGEDVFEMVYVCSEYIEVDIFFWGVYG